MILFLVGASGVHIGCCLNPLEVSFLLFRCVSWVIAWSVSCCWGVCGFSRRWPASIWMILLHTLLPLVGPPCPSRLLPGVLVAQLVGRRSWRRGQTAGGGSIPRWSASKPQVVTRRKATGASQKKKNCPLPTFSAQKESWSFQSIPLLINSINLKRDGVGICLRKYLARWRIEGFLTPPSFRYRVNYIG